MTTATRVLAAYVSRSNDRRDKWNRPTFTVTAYDSGIRLWREDVPGQGCNCPQSVLNRASAIMERRGLTLTEPWRKNPTTPFDFRAPYEKTVDILSWVE